MSPRKLLLDENIPHKTRELLAQHEVFTVAYMGWAGIKNGDLLDAAEREGFEVLVTSDQGFPHQQNLQGRKIAIVVLGNQQWPVLRAHVQAVVDAVNTALPGSYVLVDMPAK